MTFSTHLFLVMLAGSFTGTMIALTVVSWFKFRSERKKFEFLKHMVENSAVKVNVHSFEESMENMPKA